MSYDLIAATAPPLRTARLSAQNALASAKTRAAMGVSPPTAEDIKFLEATVRKLELPYQDARAEIARRNEKRNSEITVREQAVAELEERLWTLHQEHKIPTTEQAKQYVSLRQEYSEAVIALRTLQYPIQYVKEQEHAFDSAYMNERADPDAGFRKGAPIYVLKQGQDIADMIVSDVKGYRVVTDSVAPVNEPIIKRRTFKLKR